MSRRATGKVIAHEGRDGLTYRALRFTAYGKRRYVSLGAITADVAERELRHILADVERGTWQPAAEVESPPEPEPVPTFHEYAGEWWTRNERQFAPSTQLDYRWRLESHLLPFFAEKRLDEITFDLVERYIAAKLAEEEPLSARSINMTVMLLGAILEGAVERELIPRNPARGRGRRVRERAPRRSYLETAAQIEALLIAAARTRRPRSARSWRAPKRQKLADGLQMGLLDRRTAAPPERGNPLQYRQNAQWTSLDTIRTTTYRGRCAVWPGSWPPCGPVAALGGGPWPAGSEPARLAGCSRPSSRC
jgi:Phage integrase, N-terminal SAM-like domain